MTKKLPELDTPHIENSALMTAVGAAHYWKGKADSASKHRWRVFGVGIILGMILAEFGPTVTSWASSAF